ncbi:hypothetical protein ACEZCY_08910 [Streptacidiphilus sp. N1-12]|uniref:Uncharacterized protein n=2 Tax=Streptacidiphilus alkalitolerans TaxID=3342712 RepID=A0ABV6WW11_9ACTN
MNIDFSNDALFSWYVVLLLLSGLLLIGIGIAPMGSTGMRVFNALVGTGFLCYGIYLGFIFEGTSYIIFFKAFIAPVALLVNTVKSYTGRRNAAAAQARYQAQQAQAQQAAPVADAQV